MGISLHSFQLPTMPLAIAKKSFYCYRVTPDARWTTLSFLGTIIQHKLTLLWVCSAALKTYQPCGLRGRRIWMKNGPVNSASYNPLLPGRHLCWRRHDDIYPPRKKVQLRTSARLNYRSGSADERRSGNWEGSKNWQGLCRISVKQMQVPSATIPFVQLE